MKQKPKGIVLNMRGVELVRLMATLEAAEQALNGFGTEDETLLQLLREQREMLLTKVEEGARK